MRSERPLFSTLRSARGRGRVSGAAIATLGALLIGCAAPPSFEAIDPLIHRVMALAEALAQPPSADPAQQPAIESPPWWDHPARFTCRRRITVATGPDAIGKSYTVSISLDHAELVRMGKSLAGGDDVRIARWSGDGWTELHRLVGESGWNQAETQVWFALQEPLPAFSAADHYFLYYGSRAVVSAPEQPAQVYYYYSSFSDPAAFARDWSVFSVNQEPVHYAVVGGALYKENNNSLQTDRKPFINDKVVLTGRGEKVRGLYVRYRYRPGPARRELEDDLFGVGLCTADAEPAGFYAGITGRDDWYDGSEVTPPAPAESKPAAGFWRGDAVEFSTGFSNNLQLDLSARHTVVAVWTRSSLAMWLDGNFISAWPVGPLEDDYFCFASQGMPDLFIEELMLRRLVDSEPICELGREQQRT